MTNSIVHLKLCRKCKTDKSPEEFYKDRKQDDGKNPECKSCVRAYMARYLPNRATWQPVERKRCPDCKKVKPRSDFGSSKRGAGGISTYCRQCGARKSTKFRAAFPEKIKAWDKRYREQMDREYVNKRTREWFHSESGQASYLQNRRRRMLKKYGLTPKCYERMRARQRGGCAICKRTDGGSTKPLHVDHDHATGQVRGLLCNMCNYGLACFKDRLDLLARASKYLRKSKKTNSVKTAA